MNTISFPNLGLEFNIPQVAIQIGNISIYWYGIIIAAGFMLAVILALRNCSKFGIDPERFIDLILYATPVSIICARLYYVAFSWDFYRDDLMEIFRIWHGGLAIYGALIGALLTALVYAKIYKLNLPKLLDFAIPYFVLAQAIGRWGNFVNQEAFGSNTDLPWGMTGNLISSQLEMMVLEGKDVFATKLVHPTFLYESLANLIIFGFLIWYRKRKKLDGEVFSLYMILYGIGRFFIEPLRTDSLMIGNLRVSMVLAFLFVIVFSYVLIASRRNYKVKHEVVTEAGSSEYGSVLKKLAMEEENAMEHNEQEDAEQNDNEIKDDTNDDVVVKNDEENNVDDLTETKDLTESKDLSGSKDKQEKQSELDSSEDENSKD